jgi:pyruvate ferredoxin oxidoreductase alpha subunit
MGMVTSPADNLEYKYQQHQALLHSAEVIKKVDDEFGRAFGRQYNGLVEEYRCDDAEVLLITLGSVTGTARVVVDRMREQGKPVGLLKIRYMRPFPTEEVVAACAPVKRVGVLDKDISFGHEGTVFTNVNSALCRSGNSFQVINFIGGMGGRDVPKEDIEQMYRRLLEDADINHNDRVQFIGMTVSTDE